jgi:hypothetical protein
MAIVTRILKGKAQHEVGSSSIHCTKEAIGKVSCLGCWSKRKFLA